MDINPTLWVSIQRYVTGNAGPEERRLLEEWMGRKPANRRLVQEIQKIWNLTPPEKFDVDARQAWEKFKTNSIDTGKDDHPQKAKHVTRKVSKVPLYVLRLAAVILVSVFAGVFMQYTLTNSGKPEPVSDFYVMETLETDRGEKARITFSDGTKVTLNSASLIHFPKEFTGSKREVFLEGEAFFEVAHDPDYPFIVHALDAEVIVLGTEFNVRGWSEDPAVEIAVREGKVAVSSSIDQQRNESTVILTEGLHTIVNRGENPSPAQEVNITYQLLWTHGGLHFDNTPFSQVVRDIERRFNVNITGLNPDLSNIPYTGTFQYADLNEVLSVVAASMDLEYQRDGLEITLL